MKSRTWMLIAAVYVFAALAMPVSTAAQDRATQNHKSKHKQYKLIDLGTFGGPASYFGIAFDTDLNYQGTAAGWADTSTPDPNPGYCFNPDCFVSHAFQWQKGTLTDLGVLPGGSSSLASWISANGLTCGNSQNGQIDPLVPGFPELRAVIWQKEGIIDLGTLDGGHESLAAAVNNRGQVVGAFNNTIPDPFSLLGNGYQVKAFVWQKGVMQDLGTLGGPDASASLVSERGQIAGNSYINSTPNPNTGIPTIDPFIWEAGKMLDVGTLGGTVGNPGGLNNRGQFVGTSNLAGDLTFHPFIWDRGVLTDLGTLGGDNGTANWINDAGEVVGNADLPGSQTHDAFLWRHGAMTDLGNLGQTSNAYGINLVGQIVGHSKINDGTFRAFLWEDGGPMIDLNALVSPHSSLTLVDSGAINNQGVIAGNGVPAGCQPTDVNLCGHAYLLIPDGDCDSDCDARIAASQNTAAPAPMSATMNHANEMLVSPLERLRSQMRQRYHISGQPSAPRD